MRLLRLKNDNFQLKKDYENITVQYAATSHSGENFWLKMFDIFLIFAQNIDCWYTLEPPQLSEAVLTSTHNLCFVAKIRKIRIPL